MENSNTNSMLTVSRAHAIDRIAEREGFAHLQLRGPQVLLYRDHQPPGLFLLVGGAVSLDPGEGPPERVEAARSGPRLLTPLDELELPSPVAIAINDRAELYYVPRSVLLSRPALRVALALFPGARRGGQA
jgi:hypothetical protein